VVLPRLTSDLADLLAAAAAGDLAGRAPEFADDAAVCVVLASPGYPESPRTGLVIDGLDTLGPADANVFYAGVARDDAGRLVTAGGRVIDVVGHGPTVADARTLAYATAQRISWPGVHFRSDIAEEASSQ
jgi:phosphoribosylamine--glycine ligase